MRVLVLGGTGFIGRHVVDGLAAHELTLFHRGVACTYCGPEHLHGNRRELGAFRSRIRERRIDLVLDMRAQNAEDAQDVVEALTGIVDRVVVISSGSVYRSFGVLIGSETGDVDNTPSHEGSPLRQTLFPYRRSTQRAPDDPLQWLDRYDKIEAERVFAAHSALPCSVVRLPLVYGPGDPDNRLSGYIRRMTDRRPAILLRKTVAAWRNSRGYVENVAAAIIRVVLDGKSGGVYNVAEPEDFTELDWIRQLAAHTDWNGEIRLVPDTSPVGRGPLPELGEQADFRQHLRMDTTRIRRQLAYAEPTPLSVALSRTIAATAAELPPIDYREEDSWLASAGFSRFSSRAQ